jgi:hypothetical protein
MARLNERYFAQMFALKTEQVQVKKSSICKTACSRYERVNAIIAKDCFVPKLAFISGYRE